MAQAILPAQDVGFDRTKVVPAPESPLLLPSSRPLQVTCTNFNEPDFSTKPEKCTRGVLRKKWIIATSKLQSLTTTCFRSTSSSGS